MKYNRLGRTNLNVSAIGFGGLHLSRLKNMTAVQLIIRASELGINLIEVGKAYTESEEKAGMVMQKYRDKYIIATKSHNRNRERLLMDIDQSLVNLKSDYIDIYQIHQVDNPEDLDIVLKPGGTLDALKQARNDGKIKFIGITGHSPAVLLKAIQTGEFDTVQVLLNIVEREALKELIPTAINMDIGILGMKPFGGGIFLENESKISEVFKRYGDNLTNLLLGFSLSSGIPCVLTGVKTMEELEQNVSIANSYIPLSESEFESIIGTLEDNSMKDSNFCHRCGYCMDCPSHINISYILRLDEYFQRFGATKMVTGTYRHLLNSMNQCTQCGLCEKKCPFKLPIRKMLKQAHERLAP